MRRLAAGASLWRPRLAAVFACLLALPAAAIEVRGGNDVSGSTGQVWARASARPQDQQSSGRAGWPCAGRPDPGYVKTAEATGGQLFMFHPSEVADAGTLMAASFSHRETLFRAAGAMASGLHEFDVPVDATVESVLFSVSVQCLQVVEIERPSGALLQASDEGVEYHQFEAGRVVVLRAADPGTWKVRASGRGIFFIVVQAKSPVSLDVQLLARRGAELAPVFQPAAPGATQLVAVFVDGAGDDLRVRLVSASAEPLGPVGRAPGLAGDDRWTGEFTVPATPFRIAVSATAGNAGRLERVHAPLLGTSGR